MGGANATLKTYGVVGSGYGDEGKGLATDHLAASLPGAVPVRTNGGAHGGQDFPRLPG